ncbi:Hypothetical predicted protein, partial [Olea europaea subsp. europaea]
MSALGQTYPLWAGGYCCSRTDIPTYGQWGKSLLGQTYPLRAGGGLPNLLLFALRAPRPERFNNLLEDSSRIHRGSKNTCFFAFWISVLADYGENQRSEYNEFSWSTRSTAGVQPEYRGIQLEFRRSTGEYNRSIGEYNLSATGVHGVHPEYMKYSRSAVGLQGVQPEYNEYSWSTAGVLEEYPTRVHLSTSVVDPSGKTLLQG